MVFSLDGVRFLLTYPQSEFDFDHVFKFLDGIDKVQWLRVAHELHESGEPHIHCAFQFSKRFRTTNQRVFDFNGRHPNIQSIKSVTKTLKYLEKGANYKDYGTLPTTNKKENKFDLQTIVEATQKSRREYDLLCCSMGLSLQWADRIWSNENNKDPRTVDDKHMSDLQNESLLLQLSALPTEGPVVIAVIGPSGCGKTSWAKRVVPKPALFVTHMDDLRAFRAGYHKGIVFDDMSFTHMPREAQIHITDWHDTRSIHCRYGAAIIPAQTTKIFTANIYPFIDDPAINRRVSKLDII